MGTPTGNGLQTLGAFSFFFLGGGNWQKMVWIIFCIFIEKRIVTYCKENIRAPSLNQVLQWAKKLGVDPAEARNVSDRAPYRHALGKLPSSSWVSDKIRGERDKIWTMFKDRDREPWVIQNDGVTLYPPVLDPPSYHKATWDISVHIVKPMEDFFWL